MDRPHNTRRRSSIKFSKCNAQTPSMFYQIPPTVVEVGQGSVVEMWNRDACLKKKQGSDVSKEEHLVCEEHQGWNKDWSGYST